MKGRDKRRKARALRVLRNEASPKKWTMTVDFKTQAFSLAQEAAALNTGTSEEALQRLTQGIAAKPPLTLSTQSDLLPSAKKVS